MSDTKRFIINQDFPCPRCDGYGTICKTIEFDENGKSQDRSADFECMDCEYICEVKIEGKKLIIIDPLDITI